MLFHNPDSTAHIARPHGSRVHRVRCSVVITKPDLRNHARFPDVDVCRIVIVWVNPELKSVLLMHRRHTYDNLTLGLFPCQRSMLPTATERQMEAKMASRG